MPAAGKVFGIGLSRTGTSSLSAALAALGLRESHFPDDAKTRQEVRSWLATPRPELILSVLEKLDAITDGPANFAYRSLDASYPASRFVYTIREKSTWLASCERYWQDILIPYFRCAPQSDHVSYLTELSRALYRSDRFDSSLFSSAYDEHYAQARRYFHARARDVLFLDICGGEGWTPLCHFLKLSVPKAPFPVKNKLVSSWL